ncbi:VanW family protein [Abyssisolibacter fermentans]|uniref:VanW family protein n=1 Tax=Abyssisolibacter fermentans TaxID=1766203 RepID=UPI00082B38B0|nr:VanW family protein [Abyssisolibacter fermentans]
MRKFSKLLLFVPIIIIAVFGVFYFKLNTDKIYDGISVNDVNIGGLNKKEAVTLLENEINLQLENNKMQLKYEDKVYNFNYKQLGFCCDYNTTVDELYQFGRKGNFLTRYNKIRTLKKDGYNHNIKLNLNIEKLKSIANKISDELYREAKDASLKYENKKFVIKPEINGLQVNKEKLQELIQASINKKQSIDIPVNIIKPKKTKELLSHVGYKIAGFYTSFNTAKTNRTSNIKRASASINGKVLMPGEIISFNDVVGPRSSKTGYKEAKILKNGEYILGMGGGICQVSTTLYNAALFADLEIIQRHNHSFPSHYVDKGRDATVVFNVFDLKFRNNKQYPIYIMMYTKSNKVYTSIYGDSSDKKYEIKISSKVLSKTDLPEDEIKLDENLNPGERIVDQTASPGYKVQTYKHYYQNGKFIKRVKLHTDVYKPKKAIIREGPID